MRKMCLYMAPHEIWPLQEYYLRICSLEGGFSSPHYEYCSEHHKKLSQNLEGLEISGPRISTLFPKGNPPPPLKIGRNNKMKTIITWVSKIRFWWSRARWNENNDIYNFKYRNIIVQ
jgi:hypothetical protein